jgi:superfamily II DNA helicase RecQ
LAFIVDEAHVVVEWGKTFRPIYDTLSDLRHLDAIPVPLMTLSATISVDTYRQLVLARELRDPVIINIGTDRSNIHLTLRPYRYSMNTYDDIFAELPELLKVAEEGGQSSFR